MPGRLHLELCAWGVNIFPAASYLRWLKLSYPKVNQENKENQRMQHLTNLYKIFRTHAPNHDIFAFIDDQE